MAHQVEEQKISHLPFQPTTQSEWLSHLSIDLENEKVFCITAPPGSGKSTYFPLTLLQQVKDGKIIMLEPRRLAARQVAMRMSYLLNEKVGQTVGYRVRFDTCVSDSTRIEVVTEGIFTRMLISDPTLEGISVVIFDEFHERSLDSDLSLALTREAQSVLRPDLSIVIMSATMDSTTIVKKLGAKLIESTYKPYPVEIHLSSDDATTDNVCDLTVRAIINASSKHEGDILVFLPGQAEIMRCMEMLGTSLGLSTHIYPLYGLLPIEKQQKAISPVTQGERKVVLATSIAETSLTIEGVTVVIDSGLCRTMKYDAKSALSHLTTNRISHDMATQRTGRAGRLTSGTCYRLWTLATEHRMEECRRPEILDADLAPMLLNIASWGESDVTRLQWLTQPPTGNIHQAKQLLQMLGALNSEGRITPLGQSMSTLPCHPRIAKMILSATSDSQRSLAADIAALLEEKDPLADSNDTDIRTRIELLRRAKHDMNEGKKNRNIRGNSISRILAISDEYRHLAKTIQKKELKSITASNNKETGDNTAFLIAVAYPERIAKATTTPGHYKMANGDKAIVNGNDVLSASEWLAIATVNAQSGKIFLAVPTTQVELSPLFIPFEHIAWDSRQGCIVAQQEKRIGIHVVESHPIPFTDNNIRQHVIDIICQTAQREGTTMFDFTDNVQRLQRRIATVAQWHPELELPDLCTEAFLNRATEWLPLFISDGTRLRSSVSELRKIDLTQCLWSMLTYEQQQSIDHLAPTHIQVPTGSRIRIDYRLGAEAPVLSVRLQECFGLTSTPLVNGGTQPVLMELLSPGFKPVQLTQDLSSFWKSTYFEVRKELRRRYPKHYWPDNPENAEAKRK